MAFRRLAARFPLKYETAEWLIPLLGGCCLSLLYGTDNNWDLRHYHLYNAFAFAERRLSRDLFAASSQTWFNPALDLPYYFLAVRLIPAWPRLVAFLAGIPFGLLGFATLRLTRLALPEAIEYRKSLAILAAAIGLTGTATISEIGTTYGDIPVSVLVLAGLIVPLSRPGMLGVAVGGLLFGIAAGLKMTVFIFAPGAAIGLALTANGVRRFFLTGLIFTIGWVLGLAIAYGPWGVFVYGMYDSPVFPLLNQIFRSPWFPAVNSIDTRFFPRSIWQTLFYPFFWLRGDSFVAAELGVRDPRFALAYLSIAVLAVQAMRRRLVMNRAAVTLCIFLVISFIVWERMFSYLRYAMPMEVLTGVPIVLAAMALAASRVKGQALVTAISVLLVAAFVASSRPGWGRVRAFGTAVFEVKAPPIPDHTAVVFMTEPMAFTAPFLHGDDLTFLGVENAPAGWPLGQEITRRIRNSPNVMAVVRGGPDRYQAAAETFGFRIRNDSCAPIVEARQRDLLICAADHLPP